MESLDELLERCETMHGHMCPGQLLGARMARLGCKLLEIGDPRGTDRKKLIVWVEIDRCMTDAVSAVTGVRLGKRTLKFKDYGKVAATFLNVESQKAVRIIAKESSRKLADERYPQLEKKSERQFRTYREASVEELFEVEQVAVDLQTTDEPGRPHSRVICSHCGEGVNDGRQILEDGESVCEPCHSGGYYTRL